LKAIILTDYKVISIHLNSFYTVTITDLW